MTRSIPGGFDLTQDTTLAMCLQVTDRLGNVLGFTEHDHSIPRDISDGNGSITYNPEAAFARSAVEARSGGRVGSMDLIGFVDSAGLTESSIFGGFYDSALARLFLTDWTDTSPAAGIIWIEIGEFEETHVEDDKLTVTFKSLLDRYNSIQFGDYYEVDCIHILGSQEGDIPKPFAGIGCGVQLDPPVWPPSVTVLARADRSARPTGTETSGSPTEVNTVQPSDLATVGRFFEAQSGGTTGGVEPAWGTLPALGSTVNDNGVVWISRQALREPATVLSASDQKTFILSYAGDAPDDWYRRGRLLFTSGANVGLSMPIKSAVNGSPADGTLLVTTWLNFPLGVNTGSPNDTVVLIAGCDHTLETCKDKFRNLFGGFGGFGVFAPNTDEVFEIPKRTS